MSRTAAHNWQEPLPDDKKPWQAMLEAHIRALTTISKQMDADYEGMGADGLEGHASDLLLQANDDLCEITANLSEGIETLVNETGGGE